MITPRSMARGCRAVLCLTTTIVACHHPPTRPAAIASAIPAVAPDTARVEVPPQLIQESCVPPRYPSDQPPVGPGIEAVRLEFVVDTLGRAEPRTIRVIGSSAESFVNAAVAAVVTCAYRPGLIGGKRVRVRVQQDIRFRSY
jgi:hypothetical protein